MKISKRANLDIDAQLYEAVEEGDLNEVKKFLKFGADPNYIDNGGFSCLTAAVWYGFINIATILISEGADVNFKYNGQYLIHLAAASNDLAMFDALLKGGASLNNKNDDGYTPLEVAKSQDSQDVVNFIEKNQSQKPVVAPVQSKPVDKDVDFFFKSKAPSCPTCGKDAPGYTCPTCGDIPFFADDKRASRLSRHLTKKADEDKKLNLLDINKEPDDSIEPKVDVDVKSLVDQIISPTKDSRHGALTFSEGYYNIQEWDGTQDIAYLKPVFIENDIAGYRITYQDGEVQVIPEGHAREIVISPLETIEAGLKNILKRL